MPSLAAAQDASGTEGAVFESLSACRDVANDGLTLPRDPGTLRLASWNIRWFPVGNPQHPGHDTNLDWLACALTWLDADVVAVQEIQATRQADIAWAVVFDEMERLGRRGDWVVSLQHCGASGAQHVGILIDRSRVDLEVIGDLWWFNGAATSPQGSD